MGLESFAEVEFGMENIQLMHRLIGDSCSIMMITETQ